MNNVVQMKIPPKTVKKRYKGHDVKLVYQCETELWAWVMTKAVTLQLDGIADDEAKAFEEAKSIIDKIERSTKCRLQS